MGDFKQLQYQFSANIRDPENNPAPDGIEPRRMKIYQDLFYNNIEGFIENGFPQLRAIIPDDKWHRLIRLFIAHHQSRTPYFLQIAEEFLAFLNSGTPLPVDYPFLLELAHYEWTELVLSVSEEKQPHAVDGDWLQGVPVLSAHAWPLAYQFDVHRIGVDYQPLTPPDEPTFLIVYRDAEYEIGFMQINGVTYRLLQLMEECPSSSGLQLMHKIVEEMQHPNPQVVIDGGVAIFEQLKNKGIMRGLQVKSAESA